MKKKILLLALFVFMFGMFSFIGQGEVQAGVGEWEELDPAPFGSVHRSSAVVINNKIYVVGGFYGTNTLKVFDYINETWSELRACPSTAVNSKSVALNDKIYTLGGSNLTEDIEREFRTYDPATDEWSILPSAPSDTGSMVAINGKIYVAGKQNYLMYDPNTNQWSILSNRSQWGMAPSAVALNNKMYMNNYSTTVHAHRFYVYDPATDTTEELASASIATYPSYISSSRLVTYNGKIYALARFSLLEYNPMTDQWSTMSNTSICDGDYSAAVVVNGKMYVFGNGGGGIYQSMVQRYIFEESDDPTDPEDPTDPTPTTGNKALIITLDNGFDKTYLVTNSQLEAFIDWFESANDNDFYTINNPLGGKGAKDYLVHDKIVCWRAADI